MSEQTAHALVLEEPRTLRERELPLPQTGDDDALLRVEACGLCGTDHEQYTGHLHPGYGFVPGHESVGILERIGSAAAKRWGVREGDRVAVEVFLSCGTCAPCQAGDSQRCARHGLADMYGFVPSDREPGLWGGYSQYQYLAPDSQVLKVPDALDPITATMFNPLGAGVRWGVSLPGTRNGDVVAVLGPGVRGLSVVAAVKQAGAGFVMVTGLGSRDGARLATAKRFGADLTVDVGVEDPVAALEDATGGRADVVVDVTARAPAAFTQAVKLARPGGTIILAGTRGTTDVPGFRPDDLVFKELRVLGALGVDTPSYQAALELLEDGAYPFADVSRHVAGLADVDTLLETMAGEAGEPPLHAVVDPWKDT
ncbi:MAG: zinc-binding dehydrogenase [Actinobacteria bacterium]|nr:zinc-binding dehydrogenase [Actinomycetota bacterium]